MGKFICTSEASDALNFKGEKIGVSEKRALCYSPSIGRRRVYRSSFDNPQNGLRVKTFKRKGNAEALCDEINKVYNDSFKTEEISD